MEITPTNKENPELVRLCVKHNLDQQFVKDGKCSIGYKQCFTQICVRNEQECPLNKVEQVAYKG